MTKRRIPNLSLTYAALSMEEHACALRVLERALDAVGENDPEGVKLRAVIDALCALANDTDCIVLGSDA